MEGAKRKSTIRHPESQEKLQHGTAEQNSVSLLAARVLLLLATGERDLGTAANRRAASPDVVEYI